MKFDVFLSHNSKEKPAVERIAEELKREAIEPWLDKWCLTAGGNWQDELAAGLRSSSSCAVFVGASGIGDWARLEFQLATDRMAKERDFRVFLVLLPGLPDPFDNSALPPFLTTRTWVDLRQSVNDPRAFQQLVNAIKGLAPGPEITIEPRDDVCPYRGLQTFDEEHAEFFFGREADVQRLVEKLKTTRLLAVVGPSGSGKSSLVRAGLLPALKKGVLQGSEAWPIHVFTPGASPLTQLAANLQRLNPRAAAGDTLDELNADARAFHLRTATALADRPSAERVVWVVDQFEEVFTLCQNEAERRQFIANLLCAALAPGGRGVVVLTMRADFYQKCAAYPELSAQLMAQQFLVSPMSVEGLRQAIQEPAWRTGLKFEPGLVETILDDVESQPGALPLLEHALLELWERRRARLLTLEAYRESGGVEGAIAKRADAIYESFDEERQAIVRRVMLRLTQPGEGTEDTRRRASMDELITREGEADQVATVVQALADARLVMTDINADAQTVEVSHEALIRSWPRLRKLIEEDRAGLRVLRRVTEAAQEWQKADGDESLLFRGARLAQSLELRDRNEDALNDLERKFLAAGVELRDREQQAARRRARRVVIGLVIALALITVALIYAIVQGRVATRRGTEARARALAANAMAQLPTDPELALILATEAAKIAHSPETEHTLRQALARAPLHIFKAQSAAFSPDGKNLLIAGGGKVQIYEAESERVILELQEDAPVTNVLYSHDAKLIAVMTERELRVREAATGRTILHMEPFGGYQFGVHVFSPDDKFLLTDTPSGPRVIEISSGRVAAEPEGSFSAVSRDGKTLMMEGGPGLLIYDANNWKLLAEILTESSYGGMYPVRALSPDGKRVFAYRDKAAGVYDINEKRFLPNTLRIGHDGDIQSLTEPIEASFSPDGKLVAFAANGTLQLWDTSEAEATVLGEKPGFQPDLSFSPDGRHLLVSDYLVRIYDVKSKRLLVELGGVGGPTIKDANIKYGKYILNAKFSPDGKYILANYGDDRVALWDLNPWRSVLEVTAPDEALDEYLSILSIDLDPQRNLFVTTRKLPDDVETVVRVGDLWGGRTVSEIRLPGLPITTEVLVSPDGRMVIDDEGKVTVRGLDLSGEQAPAGLKITGMADVRFSADGKVFLSTDYLVAEGIDKVRLWDTDSGKLLSEFETKGAQGRAALSSSGKHVFITGEGGTNVFEVGSKRPVREIKGLVGEIMAFSPDDKLMVGDWGYPEVRDATTGRVVAQLRGHVDSVVGASFSHDGRYVVTATAFEPVADFPERPPPSANEVRVWEASTGNLMYEFRDFNGPVDFAKFSPDGKFILASAYDTAHVYACDLCVSYGELLRLAQQRRMRELTPDERARYQL